MASYQVQAKYGDYDGVDKHSAGYLANEKLLPAKILSQHKLSIQEWEEKVGGFSGFGFTITEKPIWD